MSGPATGEYDRRTALVVVDVQNDFADPRGSLYVSGAEHVVARVNREIERARELDALVIYTQDWHPVVTPHFLGHGGLWPVHCVRDSWGAELHSRLWIAGDVVRKGAAADDGYSAFTVRDLVSGRAASTPLAATLRRCGTGRVIVVGLATDYCVKETALDALGLGFPTAVVADAVRALERCPGDGERAFAAIRGAGGRIL